MAEKNILKFAADNMTSIRDMVRERFGDKHPEWAWIYDLLADYNQQVWKAKDDGQPLAWINFGVPSELFWAMDVVPVVVDVFTGMLAASGNATRYIDIAEQHVPDYICSNNKVFLGAVLSGDVPVPDMFVHPANPCDSNVATYPVIAAHHRFPYFCIDMPYFTTSRSVEYISGELRKMVLLLEKVTGRRLDIDRLKQTMEYSNQTHDYILKTSELRQAVPSPYSSLEAISEYGLVLSLAGTPQLPDYCRRRYEHTREKVARGEGHLPPGKEKIRLIWIYGAPVFDFGMFMWLEKQYGAVSVANMNNNFVMQPVEDISSYDSILDGLARKVTLLPMTRECGGPWENWLDATMDLIRRYKADAAVFAGHVACKSNWAVMKLVKDKLYDELGIHTLILEMDLFDPRITSSDSIKAQFDKFFTTVMQR